MTPLRFFFIILFLALFFLAGFYQQHQRMTRLYTDDGFRKLIISPAEKPLVFAYRKFFPYYKAYLDGLYPLRVTDPAQDLSFFNKLTPDSKLFLYFVVYGNIKKSDYPDILNEISKMDNVVIAGSANSFSVKSVKGELALKGYRPSLLMKLLHPYLYSHKEGVFVELENLRHRLYFLPMGYSYTRSYTEDSYGRFSDKSYAKICKDMLNIRDKDFYFELMSTFLFGTESLHNSSLNNSKITLISDIIGISIAEEFLMRGKGHAESEITGSHILPMVSLLTLHLANGGGLAEYDKNNSVKFVTGNCMILLAEGVDYNKVLTRIRNEALISEYIKKYQNKLYTRLSTALNNKNIFNGLIKEMYSFNDPGSIAESDLQELIEVIRNHTESINAYIQNDMQRMLAEPLPIIK